MTNIAVNYLERKIQIRMFPQIQQILKPLVILIIVIFDRADQIFYSFIIIYLFIIKII